MDLSPHVLPGKVCNCLLELTAGEAEATRGILRVNKGKQHYTYNGHYGGLTPWATRKAHIYAHVPALWDLGPRWIALCE